MLQEFLVGAALDEVQAREADRVDDVERRRVDVVLSCSAMPLWGLWGEIHKPVRSAPISAGTAASRW
ncbi:hypothetical protein ACFV4T_42990 [Streptomyces sp. NPDC059755]|uniref:hypothetical protein n=1 Tax=Streptomyces sp. NPDC059755 TaxID=3346934 RepID=UPI003653BD32